jgi:flavin reductase (DIM6/NTAB) family NADH-FMN oxidoreductase RutF
MNGRIRNEIQYHWTDAGPWIPDVIQVCCAGCLISAGNHSFDMIRGSGECVINLPTTALADTVVRIGNCSGANVNKISEFGLTARKAGKVGAPLIGECHASFECRLHDDALVDKYNYFILEVVKAHVLPRPEFPQTLQTPVTVCSWWPAARSAGGGCSGGGCSEGRSCVISIHC